MQLRVASFNVRNGRAPDRCHSWPLRKRAFAATVEALAADVIGLQEVYRFQLRWLLRRVPTYHSAGVGRRDGAEGGEHCIVLHDSERFELEGERTRWFADEPDRPGSKLPQAGHPRIATLVRLVDRPSGRLFGVANTHLDERRQANRMRSVELLLSWLDDDLPWIVVGDFNAEPDNPIYALFADSGFVPAVGSGPPGSSHRFTGTTDGPLIDNVLTRSDWEVRSAEVTTDTPGRKLPSDHWPVVADLVLL